jgi:very-short-patch-repair endonuclease
LMLVVEVEGTIHDSADQKEYDAARFEQFDAIGLKILRIKNEEVFSNMENVLKKILEFRKT